jgi:hypothetical protein
MADDIADIADYDTTEQARQRIEARKWLLPYLWVAGG